MTFPSISKSKLSRVRALHSGKNRLNYGECIAEGRKIVTELCVDYKEYLSFVCISSSFTGDFHTLPANKTFLIDEALFNDLSSQVNPEGILAVVKNSIFKHSTEGEFIVYLDGIRNPGNLGTIIRTCDWFGVDNLLISPDTVDFTNEKVIQSSMGCLWRQSIGICSYQGLIDKFDDYRFYVADMNGRQLTRDEKIDNSKTILVIGSESHGVRQEFPDAQPISIPSYSGKHIESLNASIAAAILVAWFCIG